MRVNLRREPRHNVRETLSLVWEEKGKNHSLEVRSIDRSPSGIRIICSRAFPIGATVFLQAVGGTLSGQCIVRHCQLYNDRYRIGLEFSEEAKKTAAVRNSDVDYYEFLQISPKADHATIQRIYRMLALRFHPDNPESGDPEKFLILNSAYEILSDPARRAEYDAHVQSREYGTLPVFELGDFVNDIEGEVNRRLGVLSLLYNKRRTSAYNPGVSLFELEKLMGMPREYLDFTTWYLKSRGYITIADNSEFALTADGVDYIEANFSKIPILQKLLQSGPRSATASTPKHEEEDDRPRLLPEPSKKNGSGESGQ